MDFNEKVTKTTTELMDILKTNDMKEIEQYMLVLRDDARLATRVLRKCTIEIKENPDQYTNNETLLVFLKNKMRYFFIALRLNIRSFKVSDDPLDFKHAQLSMLRMLDGMYNMTTLMRDWGVMLNVTAHAYNAENNVKYIKKMRHNVHILRHALLDLRHKIQSATSITEINDASWTMVDTLMKESPYAAFVHVTK